MTAWNWLTGLQDLASGIERILEAIEKDIEETDEDLIAAKDKHLRLLTWRNRERAEIQSEVNQRREAIDNVNAAVKTHNAAMRRAEEIQAQYDLLDSYYTPPTTAEDIETRAAARVANQELLNQARAEQKEAKREYKKWYRRYKFLNIQLRGPEDEIAYITREINKVKRVVEALEQKLEDLKEKKRLENLRREGLDDDIEAAEDKYKKLQEQGNPADDAATDN